MKRLMLISTLLFILVVILGCQPQIVYVTQVITSPPEIKYITQVVTTTLQQKTETKPIISLTVTPTVKNLVTVTPSPKAKNPSIYIIPGGIGQSFNSFLKLQSIALEMGIRILNVGDMNNNAGIIAFSQVYEYISGGDIVKIDNFVRNGGKAIIFFLPSFTEEQNLVIQNYYSINMARDGIVCGTGVRLDGGNLLPFFSGLSLSLADSGHNPIYSYIGLNTYFGGKVNQGQITQMKSSATGINRVTSITMSVGKGMLILASMTSWGFTKENCGHFDGSAQIGGSFLSDDQIELGDNKKAAQALISWLTK